MPIVVSANFRKDVSIRFFLYFPFSKTAETLYWRGYEQVNVIFNKAK